MTESYIADAWFLVFMGMLAGAAITIIYMLYATKMAKKDNDCYLNKREQDEHGEGL